MDSMLGPMGYPGTAPGTKFDLGGQEDAVPALFTSTQLVAVVVLPWLVFTGTCYLFAMSYYGAPSAVIGFVVLISVICLVQCGRGLRDRIPWRLCMSALCLVATVLAVCVGISTYVEYFSEYWYTSQSHAFANILPSESAAGYRDAGRIVFAQRSRVDVSKALGFKDGKVYCVAPVMGGTDEGMKVQFWAVGTNCCGPRGHPFHCFDAWDPKARAGLVLPRGQGKHFAQAIKEATAAYGLDSAADPVLLRWVVNPDKVQINFWRLGNGILIGSSVVHLLLSTGLACLLNSAFKGYNDYAGRS